MASEGIDITAEQAEASLKEQRRQDYLQARQDAARRDAHVVESRERLVEEKQQRAQVMQHEQVRQRDKRA